MEMEVDGGALQSQQRVVQAPHIKKRALKNKALSISFDEKDLSDFVTGFHKRKKKRRKEAQNQQQEAFRRKRIELRKKRKLDREYVIYGGAPPDPDAESKGNEEAEEAEEEEDDNDEPLKSVSGTKVYDTGNVKVMVTTSEISREDPSPSLSPKCQTLRSEKKPTLAVMKKPLKKVEKRRSRPKTQTKRDKRKGKKKLENRR